MRPLITDEILKALIGAGGAVFGALITALVPVIADWLKGRRHKWLVGDWTSQWKISFPSEETLPDDTVTIEKVTGENVRGTGHTPHVGSYVLIGRLTDQNLLTMYYQGVENRRSLGGVVILHSDGTGEKMQGHWYEYREDRKFIGGPTEWTKS